MTLYVHRRHDFARNPATFPPSRFSIDSDIRFCPSGWAHPLYKVSLRI